VAKGISHLPPASPGTGADGRTALLTAIAKARVWIEDLVEGRAASFAEIAEREGKVERHIRLLSPLAFVAPKLIADIIDDTALPTQVTELARRVNYHWSRQKPLAARASAIAL
jgi:hypothetical protein